jgi:O-antigen ligase
VVVATSPSIGLFGFRNYFEPLAVFLLARLMPFSRKDLSRLLVVLAVVAAGVAAFGIYQALAIDFTKMISMGYVDEFGNLPYAFKTALTDGQPRPRAISTVTGPNQLAVYLNLFILLAGYALLRLRPAAQSRQQGNKVLWRLALAGLIGLYSICLLLTYSRGGLLALAVSLAAAVGIAIYERGIKRTWRELTHNRWLVIGIAAMLILVVVGLAASGFATRIWRGLSGADPAALGHLSSMDSASGFIASNPLGIGLGMAGPRALRFSGDANIQHTESTYLQFGMEVGVLGMALLLIMLLSLLATLWRMRQRRRQRGDLPAQILTEVAFVTWMGALAVFVVTPLIQNFLVASYLWLIAGLAFHLDAYER